MLSESLVQEENHNRCEEKNFAVRSEQADWDQA